MECLKDDLIRTAIFNCVAFIRKMPGKVYAFELYEFFGENGAGIVCSGLPALVEAEMKEAYIIEEPCEISDMSTYYTAPAHRAELDKLLEQDKNEDMAPARIMPRLTMEKLAKRLGPNLDPAHGGSVHCDISGQTVEDFDFRELKRRLACDFKVIEFCAKGTRFEGNANFEDMEFHGSVCFRKAVFQCNTISFRRAVFDLGDLDRGEVDFRDADIRTGNFRFDQAKIICSSSKCKLSLEDAVLHAGIRVNFSRMDFGKAGLYCYQTLAPGASFYFGESKLQAVCFQDSSVGELLFFDMKHFPDADFVFRNAESLLIENCVICNSVVLGNAKRLSLDKSVITGALQLKWDNGENEKIMEAVKNNEISRMYSNEKIAEQLAVLKEYFLSVGQYELEDQAYLQYMKYRKKNGVQKAVFGFLHATGRYGISPVRIILSLLAVIVAFGLLFGAMMVYSPDWFQFGSLQEYSVPALAIQGLLFSLANLISFGGTVTAGNVLVDAISVLEALTGWFFLGYLSVAIVRKTLR